MPIFCFDASAFINPHRRYYPVDIFPSFWSELEARITSGQLVTSELVREEIDQKDDELRKWIRGQDQLIVPMDDAQQEQIATIVPRFSKWFDPRSTKNNADAFVVALAKANGLTVVSDEKFGGPTNLRIPFVCAQLGVQRVSIYDYIRQTKLRFGTVH